MKKIPSREREEEMNSSVQPSPAAASGADAEDEMAGLQADLDRTLAIAAFVIVAVGAVLNLYELLVANNVWSIAPGRSAGFVRGLREAGRDAAAYVGHGSGGGLG